MIVDLSLECQERLDRTRRAMEADRFDALLVYAGGKREMQRMDGVRYLTGYHGPGEHALLLLGLLQPPRLYVAPPAADFAQTEAVLGEVIGDEDFIAAAARDLSGAAFRAGRVGFVGRDLIPAGLFARLGGLTSGRLLPADDFLKKVGRNKTPWELERIRRAQAMADAGFRHMAAVARPGMREFELAAELERALRRGGAADNFGLVASSAHNQAIRLPTERKLESGDVIIAEISPECDGYFAQLCRTLVLGEPTPVLQEKFALLERAFHEGVEAIRPGARAVEVSDAINRIMGEAGYETYSRPPYMRSRGHGLGQGSPAPGNLSADNGGVLEKGMTFIVHPNQYLPETGYLMLGETCEVTAAGGRSFSSLEHRLFSADAR